MNKKTAIGIVTAVLMLCATAAYAQIGNGYYKPLAAWSEAITFSKQQMTRLDMTDPSYENRLNNIRSIPTGGYFAAWKKRINDSL